MPASSVLPDRGGSGSADGQDQRRATAHVVSQERFMIPPLVAS